MEELMMNIKTETVALALGNREMTLTGEILEHLEEMKRASFFYLRGLDGIIRELVLMGRGPAEELTPERALELARRRQRDQRAYPVRG